MCFVRIQNDKRTIYNVQYWNQFKCVFRLVRSIRAAAAAAARKCAMLCFYFEMF